MKLSIIPIAYLICLSIILTPITYFIIFQVIKFNKNILVLKNDKSNNNLNNIDSEENYSMANIYMQNQLWHIALAKFENEIYHCRSNNNTKLAECYNAIGLILHKLEYCTLAKKYYLKSLTIDSTYIYAQKNLQSLM